LKLERGERFLTQVRHINFVRIVVGCDGVGMFARLQRRYDPPVSYVNHAYGIVLRVRDVGQTLVSIESDSLRMPSHHNRPSDSATQSVDYRYRTITVVCDIDFASGGVSSYRARHRTGSHVCH
jgi:hypothetical protein